MKPLASKLATSFRSCLAIALGAISLSSETRAAPIQWNVQDGGNGHYYELVGNIAFYPDQVWSWQDSKVMAEGMTYQGMQGHLATISIAAENQFLLDTVYGNYNSFAWIGLTDSPDYGGYNPFGQPPPPNPAVNGWLWVTGEPVTFTGWGPGAPHDAYGYDYSAFFVALARNVNVPLSPPTWDHIQSGTGGSAAFLVEYQSLPEPSTFVLGGLGLVGLLSFTLRRKTANPIEFKILGSVRTWKQPTLLG